ARASNLVVRARGAGASLRARFAADGARGTAEPPPLGAARLTGTLRGSLERLQLDASATLESAPLALTANGTLEPRRGRADLALRIPETPLDAVQPGRAIPVLADTVTQLRGSLAGEGRARYADGAKRAELSLALREADVVTPSATLRGVSGVVTFLGPPGVTTPPGQHLAMAAIEGPLPLEDGLLVFRLEPDAVLHLEQAGWRLAGGRVQTSGRVPLAANERTVTLTVEDLDVATLLESIAFEGLSGSGTLSGTIPLRQRGERLLVENGQLTATATGTLRYRRPGAAASGGGQLDLLLGVLDDFRYDALSLGLDGDLAEPMAMTIKLRGRNPTYQGGRPVVFNVTIEAPLAGLLRTGRSTYRIPPAIEKRLEAMGLHEPAGR
ncbi:MAG TPA: YdbH domain-containing protein, partial [Candidatus Limnocylindria bacterium]|nr:YdbH domain-containing protein [Candidatus Limnocylindria bacterium]